VSGVGFDCPSLRDKQAAAKCPKFDGAEYLTDCEATKASVPAACRTKLDALANCVLGHSIGCTPSGTVDDTTPAACVAEDASASRTIPRSTSPKASRRMPRRISDDRFDGDSRFGAARFT
jgi:hypothetical protein